MFIRWWFNSNITVNNRILNPKLIIINDLIITTIKHIYDNSFQHLLWKNDESVFSKLEIKFMDIFFKLRDKYNNVSKLWNSYFSLILKVFCFEN